MAKRSQQPSPMSRKKFLESAALLCAGGVSGAAVINCFNLEDRAIARSVAIDLERFGIDPKREYSVTGRAARRGDGNAIDVAIPAYGHVLIEMLAK